MIGIKLTRKKKLIIEVMTLKEFLRIVFKVFNLTLFASTVIYDFILLLPVWIRNTNPRR